MCVIITDNVNKYYTTGIIFLKSSFIYGIDFISAEILLFTLIVLSNISSEMFQRNYKINPWTD